MMPKGFGLSFLTFRIGAFEDSALVQDRSNGMGSVLK